MYQRMNQQTTMGGGPSSELGSVEKVMEAGTGFAHSDSMEITNDPRFFQDNVLNYRLTAFATLGIVSGLMVQNSMDHMFGMRKRMTLTKLNDLDELFQMIAFLLLACVLFFNMVATYVGVAQPYHTIRLMTGGPTGFEAAAMYYLNKNIASWRHFAVHGALLSLPLFVASSAFRMVTKFEWDNMAEPEMPPQPPMEERIIGWLMFFVFLAMAFMIWYIHRVHSQVFDERYETLRPALEHHAEAMGIMSSRSGRTARVGQTNGGVFGNGQMVTPRVI